MKKAIPLALAACLTVSVGACSSAKTPAPEASADPAAPLAGTLEEGAVTVTATVEKVDLKKRKVTLKGPDGKSVTIKVPDTVQNLAQVKPGDEVVATFFESIGYEVMKPGTGTMGVAVAQEAGRAKPGERPAGFGAQAVTVTVKITAIDKTEGTVTLLAPDGETDTVEVRDRSKLDRVAVGDLVELTYTEAVAITVEPRQKK